MGYIQLTIILSILVVLLALCRETSKKVLLTPEFCFVLCFIPQIAYLFGYVEKWNINLRIETIATYIGGILLFVICSLVSKGLFKTNSIVKYSSNTEFEKKGVRISNLRLVLFLGLQFISLLIVIRDVMNVTGGKSLPNAIAVYTINNKAGGMSLHNIPGKLNMLCYTSGYMWAYYLADAWIFKRADSKVLLLANLITSFLHQLISGSRGGVLEVIVAMVIYFWFFYMSKQQWKTHIRFRFIIKLVALFAVLLVAFQQVLPYLGRTTTSNISDYIAVYLSAEVKNLDIFIDQGMVGPKGTREWMTIVRLLNFFRRRFTSAGTGQFFSLYQYVNGYKLGNVYTIFCPFINDLGYFGLFVYIPFMAWLCQLSLYKALSTRNKHFRLNMHILLYGYILTRVVYSFFSARFYEQIITTGFIWTIFFMLVVRMFIEKKIINFRILDNIGI